MALYRCAACGSPHVKTDTQNGKLKYSYLKGAVGTALLGVGGAVAGLSQETEHVFKCPDCGTVLSYPMPAKISNTIDLCVTSKAARSQLNIEWLAYKKMYKNIEKGPADLELAEREAQFEAMATASKAEFDAAVATLAEIHNAKYSKDNLMPKEVHDKGKAAIYTFIENLYRYLPPTRLNGQDGSNYNGLPVDSGAMAQYFWDYWLFWHEDNAQPLAFKGDGPGRSIHEKLLTSGLLQTCGFAKMFVKKYQRVLMGLSYEEEYDGISSGISFEMKRPSLFWTPCYATQFSVSDVEIRPPLAYPTFTYTGETVHCYFYDRDKPPIIHAAARADCKTYIESYLANNPGQKDLFDLLVAERKEELNRKEAYKTAEKNFKDFSKKQQALIDRNLSTISSMQNEITTLNRKIFGRSRARAAAAELETKVRELLNENTAIEQSIKNEEAKLGEAPTVRSAMEFSMELYAFMDYFLP